MREEETTTISYKKYWSIVQKRRYLALAVGVTVLSLVMLGSLVWPKTYAASATVYIQRSSAMAPLIRSVGAPAVVDDMLRNIKESITSRSILERVASRVSGEKDASADPQRQSKLKSDLRKGITVSFKASQGADGPVSFVVTYMGSDPQQVFIIANAVVEEFINEYAALRLSDASRAYAFIEKQLDEHKEKMEKLDLAIKSAGSGSRRANDPLRGQSTNEMQAKLSNLNSQLSSLTAKYTEEHPEVLRVRSEIEELKQQTVKGRQSSSGQVSAERGGDRSGVDGTMPQQDPLSKLQRDRIVNQRIYDDLQIKLENARVAKDIETADRKETLRIIEPPVLPQYPAKPDRVSVILAGLFLSMAAGVGTAIGREIFDRSLKDEDEIAKTLGVPVLAVIPQVVSVEDAAAISSRDRKVLMAAAVYLAIVAVVLVREVFMKFFGIKLFGF